MSFKPDFFHALLRPGADVPDPFVLARQPAFAVYRNTVMKGCIDALEANFPAVTRLVGREWFRGAAAVHVRAMPPRDPRLLCYGEGFPAFLQHFEPAASLPYLPAVADLDWAWTLCHLAADAAPMRMTDLHGLAPGQLAALKLTPHPAARWRWCGGHPAHTIWSCNREDGLAVPGDMPWLGEGSLITRPGAAVQWCEVDRSSCAFLDACGDGLLLGDAADAALDVDARVDIVALLARLIGAGAFAAPAASPMEN